METFQIALTRTYIVTINAQNESDAKFYSEFYLGDCSDLSNEKERSEKCFMIQNLEMVYNHAEKNQMGDC